jgi:hypothetical protein
VQRSAGSFIESCRSSIHFAYLFQRRSSGFDGTAGALENAPDASTNRRRRAANLRTYGRECSSSRQFDVINDYDVNDKNNNVENSRIRVIARNGNAAVAICVRSFPCEVCLRDVCAVVFGHSFSAVFDSLFPRGGRYGASRDDRFTGAI